MIKMSETQGVPSSIPNMVNMNYLSDLRKQFVRDDNGPTVFKSKSVISSSSAIKTSCSEVLMKAEATVL